MDPVWAEKVPSLEGCRAAAGWVCNVDLQHFCGELNSPAARRGLSFLGFRLFPTHRRLKKTSTSRFIRRLNAFTTAYMAEEDPVEQAALRETIQRSVQSFDAHARHGNTVGLRRRLYDRFPLIDQQALAHGTACDC